MEKTESSYKTLAIIAITVSLIAVVLGLIFKQSPVPMGSVGNSNVFADGMTNSSTTLGSIDSYATTVSAINANRQYMIICNDNRLASSGPVTTYLHFANTSIAVGEGIALEDGECYEINQSNLYQGLISAVATDTAYLTWIEK